MREGVRFNHVPYKGVPPALTALVSGEVSIAVFTPAGSGAMVKAGKLRAVAITSPNRLALFPDVPSTAESGYPYLTYWTWFGLFAPAGASAQIVALIHRDVRAILKRPAFVECYIAASSLEAVAGSPAEFADTIRADVINVGAMLTAAGLRPE